MGFFYTESSNPITTVAMTNEEFLAFHNIDRQLFSRLVVELGRETSQSTHVMAFILWVENRSKNLKIVKSLLSWPHTHLNNLADEVTVVLNCIEGADFPSFANHENPLPLIQSIMGTTFTLQYFHYNRMEIINAVTKILNDVCLSAFTDIVNQVQHVKALKQHSYPPTNYYGALPYNPYYMQQAYETPAPAHALAHDPAPAPASAPAHAQAVTLAHDPAPAPAPAPAHAPASALEVSFVPQQTAVVDEATMVTITSGEGEEKKVTKEERTIFMTFCKAYPVSEAELRQYFTRKYGEVIESIIWEDVVPLAHPSFARVVILHEAKEVIDHFLAPFGRIGLIINGKHVWARKYVRWSEEKKKSEEEKKSSSP